MKATKARTDLIASGDVELAKQLLEKAEIRDAIEKFEKQAEKTGARLQLLGSSIRLAPSMAPDIHAIVDGCRRMLGLKAEVESFNESVSDILLYR